MSTAETAPRLPAWATCLDIEGQSAAHYRDYVNEALLGAVAGPPGRVLELGCSTGVFGKALKDRFPGTHVTGVDAGRAAAEAAASRLDRVVCARIEDLDFAAAGLEPRGFDYIVAGDILEHLVNPWGALVKLRGLLAPEGRLVASIPNVRNLLLVASLALEGRFQYAERGLLDITHLRFFTFDTILAMLRETGYSMEQYYFTISKDLVRLFDGNKDLDKVDIEVGRMRLAGLGKRDLMELCTEQYVVRARLA